MEKDQSINIRKAKTSDATALATLSGELGYPSTAGQVKGRLLDLSSDSGNSVFVAEFKSIVGWIHVSITKSLQSESFAEIRGIIITKSYRNAGIGKQLVSKAENWAKNQGCNRIHVRTNRVRVQTHKFYNKLGYKSAKTQEVFDKSFHSAS